MTRRATCEAGAARRACALGTRSDGVSPPPPLTVRELEVAGLIPDGPTSAEIAGETVVRPQDGQPTRRAHPGQARMARRNEITTWFASSTLPTRVTAASRPGVLAQR
jgi:hypothetical protein